MQHVNKYTNTTMRSIKACFLLACMHACAGNSQVHFSGAHYIFHANYSMHTNAFVRLCIGCGLVRRSKWEGSHLANVISAYFPVYAGGAQHNCRPVDTITKNEWRSFLWTVQRPSNERIICGMPIGFSALPMVLANNYVAVVLARPGSQNKEMHYVCL